MTKTRLDVIAMAHRRLAVLSVGENPSPDQEQFAGDTLDALIQELNDVHHLMLSSELFEDSIYLPLSYLLASEIAPHYSLPAEPRGRNIVRLRALIRPDNRIDPRDVNRDGTVTLDEHKSSRQADYF